MPNEPTPQFSADQPLTNPADDKLNRDRFSSEIAQSLANWSRRDSLVVSLTGEWGTGKSTIKNFIVHHLKNKAYTLEFNPWQWSGQDKVLEAFLWQLGAAFGQKDIARKTERLASKWKAYASILKVGGVLSAPARTVAASVFSLSAIGLLLSAFLKAPVAVTLVLTALFLISSLSFLAKIADKIAIALADWAAVNKKPLEELRSDIAVELRKLDKPVVIFVDDIDRLTDEEIKLVVQLIKANAQFPNLIFFLLFQKNIVARALAKVTSDDGGKYLNKIVQVEFAIPAASEKQLRQMLTQELDKILTRDGIKIQWEERRWPLLFAETLWPYFANVRDIRRFLGVFEFYFAMHLNHRVLEVNPIDLIAIEVLRMFDHDAFLSVQRSFLHGREWERQSLFGRDKLSERFQANIDSIVAGSHRDEESKARLKRLLQALFPQATGDRSENEWKRNLRICDDTAFEKYFEVSTDPAMPTAYDISRFIEMSGNREAIAALLREAIANKTIEDFLDFIFVAKDEIPTDNMQTVSTALFDVGDELPDPKPSFVSIGLDMQCNRIIFHRLRREEEKRSTEILWKAFNDTTGFYLPIHKLALEDRSTRQRGEKTDFVIAENRLDDFINLILRRIRERAEDFSLLDHKRCSYVIYCWKQWSSLDEVREWIGRVITDSERALKLLTHLVSISIVNGVKRVPFLDGKSVEEFTDLASLREAVTAVRTERLTDNDRTNISLLETAIERKAEGKPYSRIRADNDDF